MSEQNSSACNSTDCRHALTQELNADLAAVLLPLTVVVGVEGCVGLLCNGLVLFVYLLRYRVCNFRYFVLFLTLTDLIGCLTTLPGEIVTHRFYYTYPSPTVCKVKSFFNFFTCALPALLLLVIACDRFLKVCYPTGWQVRPRVALMTCVAATLIAVSCALPATWFGGTRTYSKRYKGVNIEVTICEKDQRYERTQKPITYAVTFESFICVLMLTIALIYILISRQLFRKPNPICNDEIRPISVDPQAYQSCGDATPSSGQSTNAGSKPCQQRQHPVLGRSVRRKTLIMFILTAIFLVTTALYLTLSSGTAMSANILDAMTAQQKALYFFFFRLYFINHVINPVIYGFLDPECRCVIRGFFRK